MKNIFWTAYSNLDRQVSINLVQSVVMKYGDMVDFKAFSDLSLTMVIEIEELKIDSLYDALKENIGMDKYEYLNSSSRQERKLYLNITFAMGTGNRKVEVPSVPG